MSLPENPTFGVRLDQPLAPLTTDPLQLIRTTEVFAPGHINTEQIVELARELTPLTATGFMLKETTDDLVQDIQSHISESDRLIVTRINGQIAGYICSSLVDTDEGLIYNLEGIIVDPRFHGTSLALELLRDELSKTGAAYLGFHTQNIRMLGLGTKLAEISPEDSEKFGSTIKSKNQHGVVDIARYKNGSLYGDRTRFSQQAVGSIDWENGDALICVGKVKQI